jgi:glutamyl-tRNA reductase
VHLVVIGLNHKTAPVQIREKLSISDARLPEVLHNLKANPKVAECVILSTCNRTEIYAYTASRAQDQEIISEIGRICDVEPGLFAQYLYLHAGHKAAEHLFRVASGIDSMVLGEAQILGQVKDAYAAASKAGSTGPVLNGLFQQAIAVGKKVRTETEISRGAFSVGSVAVQLATAIFGTLDGRRILVVGAGEMARLILAHLVSCNAKDILVANRSYEKALNLALGIGGRAIQFDEIPDVLKTADIVIASTGSPQPVITKDLVSKAVRARRGRPIFFIDIAVPRDVEESVERMDNVFLYNIDDLQKIVEADAANRQAEVTKAEHIIAKEVQAFNEWFRALDAVPIVTALRRKFESIRQSEVEKLRKKLSDLPSEYLEAIEAATRSIVNRISHDPMLRIKAYCTEENAEEKIRLVCDVFGIPREVACSDKNGLGKDEE